MGLASYYRRFIRNFAKIAAPVTNLLQKNQDSLWTAEAEKAVEELKSAITSAPVLRIADPKKKFVVTTDASGVAVGAVLEQEDDEGKLLPVAFMSQKLRPEQRHYEVRDLELLAIVHACRIWRPYLLGQKVRVLTDHAPLQSIQKRDMDPSLPSRTLRAIEYLQSFDLDVHRVPGDKNVVADALSRYCAEANGLSCVQPSDSLHAQIRREYKNDELFKNVLTRLQQGEHLRGRYEVENGLLFYCRRGARRLCNPRVPPLINLILYDSHDALVGGHLGVDKTLANV